MRRGVLVTPTSSVWSPKAKLDRIAVAHTADDQAETVLGAHSARHRTRRTWRHSPEVGCVFRPLLHIPARRTFAAICALRRQSWREDATNRDTKRMRARIRLKLMPLLEKQFQPAVVEHLCQLADLAREDEAWLESSAELRVFLNAKEDKGEWRISLRDLLRHIHRQTSRKSWENCGRGMRRKR